MKKDATGELRVTMQRNDGGGGGSATSAAAALGGGAGGAKAAAVDTSGKAPNLLHVTIKSAKDVRAMDKNGKSDPLVKLALAGKKCETTIKEKTLRPQWNETVRVSVCLCVSVCL